ncbi:NYN domain-containing protein [Desulfitobacterium sp.]|uniref:NYN domain-containing protein n=1 Tax=Desulfitobacterium sp. TaxID=49981 RepID=UPI002B1F6B77|nr:NYN domain-containing protein [Desulfitobacterium sp.]MEA4901827.1 NYN domain-containing protein [Desulfitobacterium sp.]
MILRAIVFVDYENIWMGLLERGYELTPEILMQAIQTYAQRMDLSITGIYLYANFDREEFWKTQTSFEKTNVFTRHVFGKNTYASTDIRKNAADVELILEAQEILITRTSTFDTFLLFTGDGDFLPLARKIRAWGKDVRVMGVNGSTHHVLQAFSSTDFFEEFISQNIGYKPEQDLEQGIQILAQLQLKMAYVASTKTRLALSEQLHRTISQVKEVVRFALREKVFFEQEFVDASLKIGKTKIYLLNLEHERVRKVLSEDTLRKIQARYEIMGVIQR